MFIGKICVYAIQGICANLLDEIFKLVIVIICIFSRVRIDHCDEFRGLLAKELIKLLELLMHLRNCTYHRALYNSN